MSDDRIDLLPPVFGARARLRLLNRRVGCAILVTAVLLAALSFQARIRRSGAESELLQAQERADEVLSAELRESSLLADLDASGQRIENWRQVALPLPVGGLLVTMANTLPDGVVLEELLVDVTGIRLDPRGQRTSRRRLMGTIQGHAPDESTVRDFVKDLRERVPFEEVRRGFTALADHDGSTVAEFSVDFEVDLDTPWRPVEPDLERTAAVGGGE
ncbi:MAG: hypothetical protein MK082_04070 [Phycisphaerales bacterium]|nr:hypothetical protein [Phycisphaerales bacterium]